MYVCDGFEFNVKRQMCDHVTGNTLLQSSHRTFTFNNSLVTINIRFEQMLQVFRNSYRTIGNTLQQQYMNKHELILVNIYI